MKRKSLYFLILNLLVSNVLSAQQPQFVLPLPGNSVQSEQNPKPSPAVSHQATLSYWI